MLSSKRQLKPDPYDFQDAHKRFSLPRRVCLATVAMIVQCPTLSIEVYASPGHSISISTVLGSEKDERGEKAIDQEVSVLSALLTHHHGLTPWADALLASDRYITSRRGESLDELKNTDSSEKPLQGVTPETSIILSDFDRYILTRSSEVLATQTTHSLMPQDEGAKDGKQVESESPIQTTSMFERGVSLSHTWRKGASGYLLHARQMEKSPYWVHRRFKNYGTPEMIATIKAGVKELQDRYPNSPKLIIGDLSKRYGGHFPPHLSHQSGRDADIGYFIKGPYAHRLNGLTVVNRRTIDVERTWAFLSGMLKTGLIESAFIDYQLQKSLYRHAKSEGVWSLEELDKLFSFPHWKGGVISHLKGHSDHMHVRFRAPLSEGRAQTYMAEHGTKRLRPRRVRTRPKKGETLLKLARRFRVSWKTLMKWNHLTSAQARRPLKRDRRYIVGYYTPYYARHLTFDLPLEPPDELASCCSQ